MTIGYILVIYLVLYFGAAFALPTYRVWKRTGINPVTFRGADTAHDYIGKLFKAVMVALALAVVIYAFAPDYYPYLLPIDWLESRALSYIGIGLLLASLAWTITAQVQMGNSWRIGIDEEKETALVQKGLFRLSRNPIFLGMQITLLRVFSRCAERSDAFDIGSRICPNSDSGSPGRRGFDENARRGIRRVLPARAPLGVIVESRSIFNNLKFKANKFFDSFLPAKAQPQTIRVLLNRQLKIEKRTAKPLVNDKLCRLQNHLRVSFETKSVTVVEFFN